MVIRKHGRYSVFWLLTLVHKGIEYQGTTRNISLGGCAVKTSLPAFVGMQLRLYMMAPDHSEPLRIEKAFIRWRSQDVIGLEFSQVGEAEQSRLCRVIQDLEDACPKPSHVNAEPPLISVSYANRTDQQETVMIVDDEEAILGLCAVILERSGFRVLKAKDSAEALRMCTAHIGPIDVLLTDLVLVPRGFRIASSEDAFPQVHGHELALRALTIRPDLRVGFMSGNPDKDLAGYGIKRGAYPFLLKPFSIEQLVQFVRDILSAEVKVG
jgi:CheY-like chemotaxis protein